MTIGIGIPTRNRPILLHRALESIAQLSHAPHEVIIGDNSDDDRTAAVYQHWKTRIPSLIYIKRVRPLSALENFYQLAAESSSEYFMWLADDDVLDKSHLSVVSRFLAQNKNVQYLGWGFNVKNYATGATEYPDFLPSVLLCKSMFANSTSYLRQPISCYFYGLYHREILVGSILNRWIKSNVVFDWMDCAFVMYMLLNYRSHFLPEKLVTFGIDEIVRPMKSADGTSTSRYKPLPWLMQGGMIILFRSKLSFTERIKILPKFFYAWKNATSAAIKGI
jgi:glycosyltransferase involved in cell wall biosynthesis